MEKICVDIENIKISEIKHISEIIQHGGVVVLPTDTVYGLVCRADYPHSINRIYQIKQREKNKPLPIFVHGMEQVNQIVDCVPGTAKQLINNFWPGALTIIFPCHNPNYHEVTCHTGKIGLRMPNSKFVLQLLKDLNIPLASTSANLSSRQSAQSAEEIEQELGERIDLLVDSGKLGSGIASTVVDSTVSPIKILRSGEITREQVQKVIQTY